jgi:hypothetical protein
MSISANITKAPLHLQSFESSQPSLSPPPPLFTSDCEPEARWKLSPPLGRPSGCATRDGARRWSARDWSATPKLKPPTCCNPLRQVSKLSRCLSVRGLPIFYISAWDSDYVLVHEAHANDALQYLTLAGAAAAPPPAAPPAPAPAPAPAGINTLAARTFSGEQRPSRRAAAAADDNAAAHADGDDSASLPPPPPAAGLQQHRVTLWGHRVGICGCDRCDLSLTHKLLQLPLLLAPVTPAFRALHLTHTSSPSSVTRHTPRSKRLSDISIAALHALFLSPPPPPMPYLRAFIRSCDRWRVTCDV